MTDTFETAIWLDGKETAEHVKMFIHDIKAALMREAQAKGVVVGPPTFTEKRPGEPRVPPVPKHVSGPNVRLLVVEAPVVCAAPLVKAQGFVFDLDKKDLERLRAVVRKAWNNPALSDEMCDRVINKLGEEVALAALRGNTKGFDDYENDMSEAEIAGLLHRPTVH